MNTSKKLLTIAIPTYNRSVFLDKLLKNLSKEMPTIYEYVHIIISNNSSTDDTCSVINNYKTLIPNLIIINNIENLGSDENFARCFDLSNSKYFWLFSDDDIFQLNSIIKIVSLLIEKNPDFIYIKSKWLNETTSNEYFDGELNYYEFSNNEEFSSLVNTWLGFISGCIINKEKLLNINDTFLTRQFQGTFLPQLSWTLNMVKYGETFIYISNPLISATKQNNDPLSFSIGIFGYLYPEILKKVFSNNKKIQNKLIGMMVCNLFLSLLWRCDNKPFKKYIKNNSIPIEKKFDDFYNLNISWKMIKNNLGISYYFILLAMPVNYLPRFISIFFVIIGKIIFLFLVNKILLTKYLCNYFK